MRKLYVSLKQCQANGQHEKFEQSLGSTICIGGTRRSQANFGQQWPEPHLQICLAKKCRLVYLLDQLNVKMTYQLRAESPIVTIWSQSWSMLCLKRHELDLQVYQGSVLTNFRTQPTGSGQKSYPTRVRCSNPWVKFLHPNPLALTSLKRPTHRGWRAPS